MNVFLPGIYLAALLHGTFIISLLLKNGHNRAPSILLACFIGILMVSMWNISMPYMDVPEALKFRIIDERLYATPFFWGPLLYLYVIQLTGHRTWNWKAESKHLIIPALITAAQFFVAVRPVFPNLPLVLLICFYLQAWAYVWLSLRLIFAHQRRIQNTFSQIDHIHLNWLKRLVAIFAVALVIDASLATAVNHGLLHFGPAVGLIVLLESITIFAIGYFSLQQPEILFPTENETKNIKKKYDNSALDDPLSKQLSDQLINLMKTVQPYKRNDLKLADLAELMGLSNHHLSQVINEQLGCNFYEFINQYRIEYAAELMRSGQQVNITRLAFDAGFNNRVSFTNAFKKQMKLTPSAYLKSHALQQAC